MGRIPKDHGTTRMLGDDKEGKGGVVIFFWVMKDDRKDNMGH
jgi:hypothetical protein